MAHLSGDEYIPQKQFYDLPPSPLKSTKSTSKKGRLAYPLQLLKVLN
jgi:hypothetical protein